MTALLLVALAAGAAGFAVGVRHGAATRGRALEVANWAGQRLDAYRLADMRTDLDQVGPALRVAAKGRPPYDWATEDQEATRG